MKVAILKKIPAHPWIFALYYVAYPYTVNLQHLLGYYFFRSLLFVFIGTTVLFFCILVLVKNVKHGSILTSTVIVIFFSYSIFWDIFNNWFLTKPITPEKFSLRIFQSGVLLFALTVSLLFGLLYLLKKSQVFMNTLTTVFNIISVVLITFPLMIFIFKMVSMAPSADFKTQWDRYINENIDNSLLKANKNRDIYLIVLDAYGSTEVLQQLYDYDNSWFTRELEEMGFVVIPNGMANYNQTRTSFSSFLNMQYLDTVANEIGEDSTDSRPFIHMISNNLVMNDLKGAGYSIITLPSGYEYTENITANYQIKHEPYINSLDEILVYGSGVYPFLHNLLYQWHREEVVNALTTLDELDKFPSPKFVLAHIYAPHAPFVFDANGNAISTPYRYSGVDARSVVEITSMDYYQERYSDQVEYVSSTILETIANIIKKSDPKPIIILCGDHGPGATVSSENSTQPNYFERVHILNALYLPDIDPNVLSQDHTHVNTFRIIFNEYFNTDYPLLPNLSFISTNARPYKFRDVTEESKINMAK